MRSQIILVCMVLLLLPQCGLASVQITVLDTLNGSNAELNFYNASGNLETMLLSNGSTHTFPLGAYVVQVLPSDAGYRASPIKLFELFFIAVGAVFGFIMLAVLLVGLGKIIRNTMEVWM